MTVIINIEKAHFRPSSRDLTKYYTVVPVVGAVGNSRLKLLADHHHKHGRKRTNNIVRYYCCAKKSRSS